MKQDELLKWLKKHMRRYQRKRYKSYRYQDVNLYGAKEDAIKQLIRELTH